MGCGPVYGRAEDGVWQINVLAGRCCGALGRTRCRLANRVQGADSARACQPLAAGGQLSTKGKARVDEFNDFRRVQGRFLQFLRKPGRSSPPASPSSPVAGLSSNYIPAKSDPVDVGIQMEGRMQGRWSRGAEAGKTGTQSEGNRRGSTLRGCPHLRAVWRPASRGGH